MSALPCIPDISNPRGQKRSASPAPVHFFGARLSRSASLLCVTGRQTHEEGQDWRQEEGCREGQGEGQGRQEEGGQGGGRGACCCCPGCCGERCAGRCQERRCRRRARRGEEVQAGKPWLLPLFVVSPFLVMVGSFACP